MPPNKRGNENEVQNAVIVTKLANIEASIAEIKIEMKEVFGDFAKRFVTQEQFAPVRMVVFGLVGTILLGFISAIGLLVYNAPA